MDRAIKLEVWTVQLYYAFHSARSTPYLCALATRYCKVLLALSMMTQAIYNDKRDIILAYT